MSEIIEVFDDALDHWVSRQESWDPLVGGFQFIEGPTWIPEQQALYFSDIPADRVYRWDTDISRITTFLWPSRKVNGMTRDPEGFLYACQQTTRQVVRVATSGEMSPVATHYQAKRLNSPNDVVVAPDGGVWFTDPTFGIASVHSGYPAESELPYRGVYRLDPKSGSLVLMIDDCDQPNGLAISPRCSTLYVSDSARGHLRWFSLTGEVCRDKGVFAYMDARYGPGVPDGLRVTASGEVFAAGPGGIWVYGLLGQPLGIIRTAEVVANLEFGGPTFKTLFATVSSTLCSLNLRSSAREASCIQ